MNHWQTSILYILGTTGLLIGQAHSVVAYDPFTPLVTYSEEVEKPRDEISPAEEQIMWDEIRRNIAKLREKGTLTAPAMEQAVAFHFHYEWPQTFPSMLEGGALKRHTTIRVMKPSST